MMYSQNFKNVKFISRRFITLCSQRIQSSLKDVDNETLNLLSHYKSRNSINLSVRNNVIPNYLKEYLISDLNKNLYLDIDHFKMIEESILNSFNLEKKYWGCLFRSSNYSDSNNNEVDDYFLLKLFRSFVNSKNKIMHISFSLSDAEEKCEKGTCKNPSIIDDFYNTVYIKNKDQIDYMEIKKQYDDFSPNLIYIDETNNPYSMNYEFINNLKNRNNCIIITNISNKANIISQNLIPSPFNHSDIVFTFLNENMRAYNCYIIMYKKGYKNINEEGKLISYEFGEKLKKTFSQNYVNNTIFSLATSFKFMRNTEFKEYVMQSNKNTSILSTYINKKYFNLHYSKNSNFLNLCSSNSNFNIQEFHTFCKHLQIFFDIISPFPYNQKSFNIGSNYLTSLGLLENDMKVVTNFINQSISLYFHLKQNAINSNTQFAEYIKNGYTSSDMLSLSNDIFCFISSFPSPHSN
ncbi:serine hydroxymethyltransferase, putative [Plasmodium malariae]|uniref:Serine hydroxymethyltransferase, putative n=2 Tax=Plasmodium malariae TaxID=5858 RepID=A0A1D3SQ29_PLAMA|nr:serine hydroxymethyltransferase, putative [Plasmodium malariae]SCO94011.1 serine hydroxymethyltransferase, putative [Plasmodium malariae]